MKKKYSLIILLLTSALNGYCQWSNTGLPYYRITATIGDTLFAISNAGPPSYIYSVYKGTGNGNWECFIDSSLSIVYMDSDNAHQQFSLVYEKPNGIIINQIHLIGENRIINIASPLDRVYSLDGNRLGTKATNNLYLSSDTGTTWQNIFLPYTQGNYSGSCILKDSIVLVSSRFPVQGYPEWLYISKDYGQTFTEIAQHGWFIVKLIEDRIFLSDGSHLYRSEDLGTTWEDISFNGFTFSDLAYKNGVLLCGTGYSGIWASTDFGNTWINFSDGLSVPYSTVTLAITDSFYFAIMYNKGFWQRPITDLVSVPVTKSINVSVFPNPFTDDLYLETPWPSGEIAVVTVYDTQGKCVFQQDCRGIANKCKLNLGFLSPGIYSVSITGEKLHVVKKVVKTD